MDYFRLRGVGVSPGIAIGEVFLTERVIFTSRKETISHLQVEAELERLKDAIGKTGEQLTRLKDQIKEKIGEDHSFIFEAHLLILKDKSLFSDLVRIIKEENSRAEWALSRVHEKYQKLFESISDEYFRQRKSDIEDVLTKIYRNLKPTDPKKGDDDKENIL
ncbi:unnamed protein product, partial [marine sediment metagenome]